MKKMLFVMNPYAGQRKGAKNLAAILEIFNRAGYAINTYMTAGPGDGEKMVRQLAHKVDVVVCCGGDGTFNETVSGVLSAGADVPIGYIPAGSTNDFATSMGLSTDVLQAARDIVSGTASRVDVGRFNGRLFSYVASFGAFTRTSYATPQNLKNLLGHTAYLLSGIKEVTQIRSEWLHLELPDGRVIEGKYIFGAVSNSTSVAGILTLPKSRVDMCDGKLELLLVRAPQDLAEITELIGALQKKTYQCAMMTFLSASGVTVTTSPDMAWTLDGERQEGARQIHIQCCHRAVQVIHPGEKL